MNRNWTKKLNASKLSKLKENNVKYSITWDEKEKKRFIPMSTAGKAEV